MPTPQITLRVSRERHLRWKQAAAIAETSVSEQIRDEMDDWARQVLSAPAVTATELTDGD